MAAGVSRCVQVSGNAGSDRWRVVEMFGDAGSKACVAAIAALVLTIFASPVAFTAWGFAVGIFSTRLVIKAAESYDDDPLRNLKRATYQFTSDHPRLYVIVGIVTAMVAFVSTALATGSGTCLGGVAALTIDTRQYLQMQQRNRLL